MTIARVALFHIVRFHRIIYLTCHMVLHRTCPVIYPS
jgi:hypothetical protein